MNLSVFRRFFLCCTICNGGLLILLAILIRAAGHWIFGVHSQWIALTQEQFNLAIYLFLGIFKLLVIVFNLVPYLALVIMSRRQRPS